MSRRKTPTMNPAQHFALSGAEDDGRLVETDRRILNGLVRKGWAFVVETKKRRKTLRSWVITEAGRVARDTARVVEPPYRVDWSKRPHTRTEDGSYLTQGHELRRPAVRGLMWRLLCPASPGKPVGYFYTIGEAVIGLDEHTARHFDCGTSDVPLYDAADLVDLDDLDDETSPPAGDSTPSPWPTLRLVDVADEDNAEPAAAALDPAPTARPTLRLVDPEPVATTVATPVQLDLFGTDPATWGAQ